ncbi:hypothetical protein HanIR_Chr11g0514151 [Helianthus annuus]|nr:hypothetical protein HanIR_Chr11g0514151 [Helianthus annuus]
MQLISPRYHRYIGDISVIGLLVRYRCKVSVPILSAILTDISPIFPMSVHFFLVLPFVFLRIAAISILILNCQY